MATLTPRMQIERLSITDDPITVCGHTVERVDNNVYLVDGREVGKGRGAYSVQAIQSLVTGLVTGKYQASVKRLPASANKQAKNEYMDTYRTERMHPCTDCPTLVNEKATRCKPCAAKERQRVVRQRTLAAYRERVGLE